MAGAVDSVNNIVVSFDDLWDIAADAEGVDAESRNLETLMYIIARRFKNEPQKAGAVLLRMQALAGLLIKEGVPSWTLPQQPDGAIPTQESVLAAAAVQPLIEVGNNVTFEREPFLKKVLELSETEGHA
ncbi:MAG: hypothetical protein AB1560_02320 [Pseudomonadota bacterium]